MIYFAYGSNTNPKVMLSRIPNAQFYGRYSLKDWELRFAGHSRNHRQNGVLDIKPNPNSTVHGILWQIPDDSISSLDHEEGCKYHHFSFLLNTGEKAFSYTMVRDAMKNKPHLEYVDIVLNGYKLFGLPKQDVMLAYYKSLV